MLLDPTPSDDSEQAFGPIAYLSDASHEPTAVIESHQRDVLASDGIANALAGLDERSRRIVEERWLKVNDDGSGGMTLHELVAVYGVSAERIRQMGSRRHEEDEESADRSSLIRPVADGTNVTICHCVPQARSLAVESCPGKPKGLLQQTTQRTWRAFSCRAGTVFLCC